MGLTTCKLLRPSHEVTPSQTQYGQSRVSHSQARPHESPSSTFLDRFIEHALKSRPHHFLGKLISQNLFLHLQMGVITVPILRTSLAVQWLRLWAPTAGGMGSSPGRGIKIPHALWVQPKKKVPLNCSKDQLRRWTRQHNLSHRISTQILIYWMFKMSKNDSWTLVRTSDAPGPELSV